MTEDQIRELVTASATVQQLVATVSEMREEMRETFKNLATRQELKDFITRTEHAYEQKALTERVDRLEATVKDQSPSTIGQRLASVASGIVVLAAAVGVIAALVKWAKPW